MPFVKYTRMIQQLCFPGGVYTGQVGDDRRHGTIIRQVFWPWVVPFALPNLDKTETDVSIWTSQQHKMNGIPHYKKVMMAGGYLDNFWHGVALLNVWCQKRNDKDMHFLVQFKDDP